MKIKYFYQLLISHIGILLMAFLILTLLFSEFVENYVFENKVEELDAYGNRILRDLTTRDIGDEEYIVEYNQLLSARRIDFILFDRNKNVVFPELRGHQPILTKEEWERIFNGERVTVKRDLKRFDKEVSLVVLPYVYKGSVTGGILLASPISGSMEMISELNRILLYTIIISLSATILLSLFLSKNLIRRITQLRKATSMISSGDYEVHIQSNNRDEIGLLAEDFNQMAAKLQMSKEEIERLENRRRKFIADVSHEMRTPLTTISGLIEGIKNDLIPEDAKEKGYELIDKESKRLIRLVNENLDYERIRSNQVKLHKVHFDLLDTFELIKDQLYSQAEEKENELLIEVDENIKVFADYDRLIQIVMNIAKNSIQFTAGGQIFLRGKESEDSTIIEVEDTGIGIAPKEIESIWMRFYKADLSRKSTTFGEFGIGLSIVKQLVQLHDGEIQVTSEKGKGTKFTITFPKNR